MVGYGKNTTQQLLNNIINKIHLYIPNASPMTSLLYPHPTIESLLQPYKAAIGPDYEKYSNHVHRVFYNCLLINPGKANEEKYAIASVFHDIGNWTDRTIDYLDPSIAQARLYLTESDRQDWTEEVSAMICWHHKIRRYKGPWEKTVETFRKADWIDVSLGLLTYGFDKKAIRQNRKQCPNRGFHFFLIKKVGKNFFKHPLNPLPMFKK